MGNTLLAHALFSTDQLQIDPIELFSDRADAHSIVNLNQSTLTAWHEREMPADPPLNIVLTVICQQWDEILRKKLSYEKWFRCYPTESTLDNFYQYTDLAQASSLELLTTSYYHELRLADLFDIPGNTITLTQYFNYYIDPLRLLSNQLGWKWNEDRSRQFHKVVIDKNQLYIDWLNSIKSIISATVAGTVIEINKLEFWEKATIIAMCCYIQKIDPMALKWDNQPFLATNNQSLINSLK
jgi:hypothetical protein